MAWPRVARPVLMQRSLWSVSSPSSPVLLMTAVDEDEVATAANRIDSEWYTPGLKKEVQRLILRCHKKIGKAHERLTKARDQAKALVEDESATLSDLEQCPDVNALELELKELQSRLRGLHQLEEALQPIKKKSTVLPAEIAQLVVDLGVDDQPLAPAPRGPGKIKGPRERSTSRKPYRRFYSFDNIEIRVGKKAEDNDQLTLSPKHRDGGDWWMHASGCPGSHVVIRCHDEVLDEQVVEDAAALAARQSKCQGSIIHVSLTRCRDIKKPPGAKAGLVQLTGKVRTVSVNMKEAEKRLERLDATVKVN